MSNAEIAGEPTAHAAPAAKATTGHGYGLNVGAGMMSFGDLITTAIDAIRAHPLRSALTSLGVVIGVGSVVAMTSIGLGAQQQVTNAISNLGSNVLMIMPGAAQAPGGVSQGAGSRATLTEKDVDALKASLVDAETIAAGSNSREQLIYEGANWQTQIQGASANYLEARDWKMAEGRFFDDRELRTGAKVVILGQTVVTNLYGGADPIGTNIRIRNNNYQVIGVLAPKGQSGFQDMDDTVMAPLDTVRTRFKGRNTTVDQVDTIYVKGRSADQLAQLQDQTVQILLDKHRISDPAQADFRILNSASLLEARQSATETFTMLLAAVAGVSLVVGGVGIMNIMLVAVTERTREIGLRMALGARRGDILRQFALESTTLAIAGGVLGLVIGAAVAVILAIVGHWPVAIAAWAPPVAIGFSALIGVGFGAYPAYQAAQLDPIEALRRD
jgi:putative ABC transport system permease protein